MTDICIAISQFRSDLHVFVVADLQMCGCSTEINNKRPGVHKQKLDEIPSQLTANIAKYGIVMLCFRWNLFLWLLRRSGNGVCHVRKVAYTLSMLILGLVIFGWSTILRPTQSGQPSVVGGRCNKYWRWFRPQFGKKQQVLRLAVCPATCYLEWNHHREHNNCWNYKV